MRASAAQVVFRCFVVTNWFGAEDWVVQSSQGCTVCCSPGHRGCTHRIYLWRVRVCAEAVLWHLLLFDTQHDIGLGIRVNTGALHGGVRASDRQNDL